MGCHRAARWRGPVGFAHPAKLNLDVVPAKAGTHSHRPGFGEDRSYRQCAHFANHAVWVPAFAGTTEGHEHTHSRGMICPSCARASPSRGGRGEHRVPLHPQSRVQQNAQRTHTSSQQVQPNTSGIPRAMLDDLFRALLGVPGFSSHRAPGLLTRGLTPASGCRDHTALSNASPALRPCASIASIATRPTFRDDRP
jgi:hypothetical protein